MTMSWFPISRFPLREDLRALNALLQAQGFVHRFTEEQDQQVLWILGEGAARQLQQRFTQEPHWYRQVAAESAPANTDIAGPGSRADQQNRVVAALLRGLHQYPLTLLLIAAGLLGALLIGVDSHWRWAGFFTSQAVAVVGHQLQYRTLEAALLAGQWWRLVTPIFLHFGAIHIIFNALWLWEFGRRIEPALGSGTYAGLILLLAISSNGVQYGWEGPSLFGGLSGVVYGLVGFIGMRQRVYPGSIDPVAPGIIVALVIFMALGMVGIIDLLIIGQVANAAHVSGFVVGLGLGLIPCRTHPQRR